MSTRSHFFKEKIINLNFMSNGTLNFSYLRYEDEQKAGVVIEGDHIFISRYEPTIGKSRNRTKN